MSFGLIMFCLLALQAISDIVGSGSSKRNGETAIDQRFGEGLIDVSDMITVISVASEPPPNIIYCSSTHGPTLVALIALLLTSHPLSSLIFFVPPHEGVHSKIMSSRKNKPLPPFEVGEHLPQGWIGLSCI